MASKTFQLTLTKDRFNKTVHLKDEFGLQWRDVKQILSATLIQYGEKKLSKQFLDDGYIFYYINKDRKCSMRFNISCALGTVEVKNPDIDVVVIEFNLELRNGNP